MTEIEEVETEAQAEIQAEKETEIIIKNIVIVGDGAVGKTCLLYAYSNQGEFRVSYVPTM